MMDVRHTSTRPPTRNRVGRVRSEDGRRLCEPHFIFSPRTGKENLKETKKPFLLLTSH